MLQRIRHPSLGRLSVAALRCNDPFLFKIAQSISKLQILFYVFESKMSSKLHSSGDLDTTPDWWGACLRFREDLSSTRPLVKLFFAVRFSSVFFL